MAADCTPENGCEGKAYLVEARGGITALVVEGPPGTTLTISWLEDGIYFDLYGPAETFPLARAVAIADALKPAAME